MILLVKFNVSCLIIRSIHWPNSSKFQGLIAMKTTYLYTWALAFLVIAFTTPAIGREFSVLVGSVPTSEWFD